MRPTFVAAADDLPAQGAKYRLGVELQPQETFTMRDFVRRHFEVALVRTGSDVFYRVFRPSGAIVTRYGGACIHREAHITRVTHDEVEWATGALTDLRLGADSHIGPWTTGSIIEVVAVFGVTRAPAMYSRHSTLTVNPISAEFAAAHARAQRMEAERLRPTMATNGSELRLVWDEPKTKFHLAFLATALRQSDALWWTTSDQSDWVLRPDPERPKVYIAHSTRSEVREFTEAFIQNTVLTIGREGPFGEITAIYSSAPQIRAHTWASPERVPRLSELPREWVTRAIDQATAHLRPTLGLTR